MPDPPASPSPLPTAAVGDKDSITTTRHTQVGHLPVIDIVPIFTAPGADLSPRQTSYYQYFDVGGTIKIPITRELSFSFDRDVGGTLDEAPESFLVGGVRNYPTIARDVILVQRLDYKTNGFTVEGGYSFRHRAEGSGESAAAYPYTVSSSEWHYWYLGVGYVTNPIRAIANSQFTFNVTGEYQPVDQHVAVQGPNGVTFAPANSGQSQYYESTETLGLIVPFGHGVTASVQNSWGTADFFENAAFPYHWDGFFVGRLTKKFNDNFSMTLLYQDEHFAPQGSPLPYPNALHTEAIAVLADVHLDFNKFIHKP